MVRRSLFGGGFAVVLISLATSALGATRSVPTVRDVAMRRPGVWNGSHFKVKPRKMQMICADDGAWTVHWRSYTAKKAVGSVKAHPCRGRAMHLKIVVFKPILHEFTRLTIHGKYGVAREELAESDPSSPPEWALISWVNSPDSGLTPWPPGGGFP